tara:strand:+ start:550 stop:1068 length:519 start_codon:yes stop_codon:yes gene_type:complete
MNSLEKFIREDISPAAKLVYLYLEGHFYTHGKCYPRHQTIASDLHMSRRTVIRCINELKEHKFLKSKRLRSSCAYLPINDVSKSVYISKPSISNKDISRTIAHVGKNLKSNYRQKVQAIKRGHALSNADQKKVDDFLKRFDKYDRPTLLQLIFEDKIELPEGVKPLWLQQKP